jgi:hypothetical protein
MQVPALFPFGHGLSYANISYQSLHLEPCNAGEACTAQHKQGRTSHSSTETAAGQRDECMWVAHVTLAHHGGLSRGSEAARRRAQAASLVWSRHGLTSPSSTSPGEQHASHPEHQHAAGGVAASVAVSGGAQPGDDDEVVLVFVERDSQDYLQDGG